MTLKIHPGTLSFMTLQLGWDDLLIQDFQRLDWRRWLGEWSDVVSGRVAPVYMSKFGDWFLRHPDGSTSELSVIEGTYAKIASIPDEFMASVNSQKWQEEHLLSHLVYQLHERQTIPAEGQCYGFAPHPRVSGRIDVDHAMVTEIGAWQAVSAAAASLKIGATITALRVR